MDTLASLVQCKQPRQAQCYTKFLVTSTRLKFIPGRIFSPLPAVVLGGVSEVLPSKLCPAAKFLFDAQELVIL